MDALTAVKNSRMRPVQYLAILACIVCQAVDGFDFFAMSFALPLLPDGFATQAGKGYLVSSALVGIGVGAVLLAPLADRWGRRRLVLLGLGIDAVGMIASALSVTFTMLLTARFITGVGVGLISAIVVVVAIEYSPTRRQNLVVGLIGVGFTLGTLLAGVTGVWTSHLFGDSWQTIFWTGAVLSAVGLAVVGLCLPESLAWLMTQSSPRAQAQTAALLAKLGVDATPATTPGTDRPAAPVEAGRRRDLLSPALRERTILLWVSYLTLLAAYYFITSWTPQLISTASGEPRYGALVGTIISVGGFVGAIVFGVIGIKVAATTLSWVTLFLSAAGVVWFALTLDIAAVALVAASVLGLSVQIALSAAQAIAPPSYPTRLSATGYGTMLGIGRVGAILAPILAGYAIAFASTASIYIVAALLLVVAALCVLRLWRRTREPDAVAHQPGAARSRDVQTEELT